MRLPAPRMRQAAMQFGAPAPAPALDRLLVGGANRPVFERVRALSEAGGAGVHAVRAYPGSGLSTLLRAACRPAGASRKALYLDGAASARLLPGPPSWLAGCRLFCIDRPDLLAPRWRASLEAWLQAAQREEAALVLGVPADLDASGLPEALREALEWAPAWVLHWMDDETHRQMVLQWGRREGVRNAASLAPALVSRGPRSAAGLRQAWDALLLRAARESCRPSRAILTRTLRAGGA